MCSEYHDAEFERAREDAAIAAQAAQPQPTPGPWRNIPDPDPICEGAETHFIYGGPGDGELVAIVNNAQDAQLIAALPKLVAALRGAKLLLDAGFKKDEPCYRIGMDEINEALAMIEGGGA